MKMKIRIYFSFRLMMMIWWWKYNILINLQWKTNLIVRWFGNENIYKDLIKQMKAPLMLLNKRNKAYLLSTNSKKLESKRNTLNIYKKMHFFCENVFLFELKFYIQTKKAVYLKYFVKKMAKKRKINELLGGGNNWYHHIYIATWMICS